MEFNLITNEQLNFREGLIILPCFEKEFISFKKLDIPNEIMVMANNFIKSEVFYAKLGKTHYYNLCLDNKIMNVILVGLGKKEDITLKKAVTAFITGMKKALSLDFENIHLAVRPFDDIDYTLLIQTVIRTAILSQYKFDRYKKQAEKNQDLSNISIIINEDIIKPDKSIVEKAKDEAKCISYVRDLVNEPANTLTPKALAKKAQESAKLYGYEAEIFDEKYIEKMQMGAFLAVAKGSKNSPRLIVLRYKGNPEDEKIYGLVGKGLCYDSGGYSIKPTSSMLDMKSDMGGSATVIGAMNLIAKNKLPVNITAVIASCENMISGKAYKPGDVIYSMDKTSIEIGNTDAEGRLTLADAITYSIQVEKVCQIIELSTLTGAVLIALGEDITGAVTKYDYLYNDLKTASKDSLDEIWQLPYYEKYNDLLKSDIADTNNIGGRYAGSITAGLFVTKFAKDTPMIHLDIAGSAWSEKPTLYCTKGGTGNNTLMLYKYFENLSK